VEGSAPEGAMATRASTGVGASLECGQQQHHLCQQAGCRCLCHYPAKDLVQRTEVQPIDEPPPATVMVCPKCQRAPKPNDKFCRSDGTKLVSAYYCGQCQAVTLPGDLHCWSCGGVVNG
jgi:hypothetical protein